MSIINIDIKLNDVLLKTIDLDADVLFKEIEKQHQHTTSEQDNDDISKVKEIGMTNWISIKSFIEENDMKLTDPESGVLDYYIKNEKVSAKQARVLIILLSKIQNMGFTPILPF